VNVVIQEIVSTIKWILLMIVAYALYMAPAQRNDYRFFFKGSQMHRGNTRTGQLDHFDWDNGRWIEIGAYHRLINEPAPKNKKKT
jgi:hypothetical protein